MADTKEMKALLGKLVSQLENAASYADAIYMEQESRILAKDKTGTETRTEGSAGVKLRAFDGLHYHEACVQGWQPALLQQETQALIARVKAKPVTGKTVTLKLDRSMLDKEYTTACEIDPATTPIHEVATILDTLYAKVSNHSKEFVNCRITYRQEIEKRVYVNRYKKLASRWAGCTISILPFIQAPDGSTRFDYMSRFANGLEVKHIPEATLKAFLDRSVKIKSAGRIPPGKYHAILSPNVTGLLAHESFGHGMESDTIMKGRAKAEEFFGKRIAPAKVNICEDPSLPKTHGQLFFDDEGVLPARTHLVKGGIVTAPITESYSAAKRNFLRTANARAESFDHKIYARMTNTFFLPGKDNPADLIKGVKNGIYLHHGSSGMEDPKGWGVQIAGILAERIKNGKLTGEFYHEVAISGYLPTILNNIVGVGKDFAIEHDAGACGKGHKEWVRVASGGPHLAIKELDLT